MQVIAVASDQRARRGFQGVTEEPWKIESSPIPVASQQYFLHPAERARAKYASCAGQGLRQGPWSL